ncbi:WD40-repeat-containing domain protein [Aspergillus transmontanensis]|uniref:WD40-repeat-containing domain protein n=1 Tax=Aspergillus transmontanensis TaxID=1034304 RepID=A0A5N6VFN2_9EURO|nr:WD40-repeat-containing domain protein [Aspergillus transmontanensis]
MEDNWSACLQTLEGHSYPVGSLVFSRDSQLVASASYDNTVKIWDVNSGRCLQTLESHSVWVKSVVFSRDSQLVALASYDTVTDKFGFYMIYTLRQFLGATSGN